MLFALGSDIMNAENNYIKDKKWTASQVDLKKGSWERINVKCYFYVIVIVVIVTG